VLVFFAVKLSVSFSGMLLMANANISCNAMRCSCKESGDSTIGVIAG
jgi:hypothetical protein